jgi:hypothetical protein
MHNAVHCFAESTEIPESYGRANVLLLSSVFDGLSLYRLENPFRAINSFWNTTGKLESRIQTNQTFVSEESYDQKSHILEYSVQEISPVVDVLEVKTGAV